MAWKKSPKELEDFLDEYMENVKCEKRKMFDFSAYFIKGNMFIGYFQELMSLRLSQEDRNNIQGKYMDVKLFEPQR